MKQQFNPKNSDLLININGELYHRDVAGVSPFDSAVQGGDAVWEGLRLYQGRIFKLIPHLDRLRDSAKAMAFSEIPAHDEIIGEIRKTLMANNMTDGVHIRLTLSRGVKYTSGMDTRLNTQGPTLIVLAEHKPPVYDKRGIRLITSSIRRIPPDCVDQNIHSCNLINSILAKIQANAAGADDALMLDYRGYVAETNATHVFIAHDGELLTSDTGSCPEGITRAAVLEICRREGIPHRAKDISLSEAYRADEMFCTGTMGELAPVVELDGRRIGDGLVGPMTLRLSEFFPAAHRARRLSSGGIGGLGLEFRERVIWGIAESFTTELYQRALPQRTQRKHREHRGNWEGFTTEDTEETQRESGRLYHRGSRRHRPPTLTYDTEGRATGSPVHTCSRTTVYKIRGDRGHREVAEWQRDRIDLTVAEYCEFIP